MAGRGGSVETVGEGRPYLLHCGIPTSIELQLRGEGNQGRRSNQIE